VILAVGDQQDDQAMGVELVLAKQAAARRIASPMSVPPRARCGS
jgi:hypothetical protein